MIVLYPDQILRESCNPVQSYTHQFFDKLDMMRKFAGDPCIDNGMLGVAANQLGFNERFFLFYDLENYRNEIAINPIILDIIGPFNLKREGCLSLPRQEAVVQRPTSITVQYTSYNNDLKVITRTFKDLAAQIMCHETDHLNGKLIIDYANREPISGVL